MNETKVTDGMPCFKLELTDEQNAHIQSFWDAHASGNCLMLAQPKSEGGKKWAIFSAMLYDDSAELIGHVFRFIKKADYTAYRLETGE